MKQINVPLLAQGSTSILEIDTDTNDNYSFTFNKVQTPTSYNSSDFATLRTFTVEFFIQLAQNNNGVTEGLEDRLKQIDTKLGYTYTPKSINTYYPQDIQHIIS